MSISSLTQWLITRGMQNVVPITIKISRTEYNAARYGSPVFQDSEFVYLLGDLPTCYKRRKSTAFLFPDDSRDWFMCSYISEDRFKTLEEKFKLFHPFGPYFMLRPWTAREPIDKYERYPYKRIRVEIVL